MKALLWKDYRVNRTLLGFAVLLVVAPIVVIVAVNFYAQYRYGRLLWPWPSALVNAGTFGLACHLMTITMFGGTAIAAERADRSAEFLAYLPPSRAAILISKAILAIGAALLICLIQLGVAYGIAPQTGILSDSVMAFRGDVIPVLAPTAVLLFGAAWLGSSFMTSHTLATGLGIAAPIALAGGLAAVAYFFDLRGFDVGGWYKGLCVPLGVVCFVAGVVYYLRRVEP